MASSVKYPENVGCSQGQTHFFPQTRPAVVPRAAGSDQLCSYTVFLTGMRASNANQAFAWAHFRGSWWSRFLGTSQAQLAPINPNQSLFRSAMIWGVSQRPLTLVLLQKYRDTNGGRLVIQIGGVYTTFCQEEGILLQKYRGRNGRCIAMLFKSIPGGPKRGCFKPGCLQFLRRSALLCSFAPFCALLRIRVCALLRTFCALLRSFACFCVRPRLERPRLGTAEYWGQGSVRLS